MDRHHLVHISFYNFLSKPVKKMTAGKMQSSLISFALSAPNEGDVSAHFKQIITTTIES